MHTIVIADDNISFAEEMRNYFTDNTDFKVVGIAPDGVEAIKLVEKHKPDFLLLDIVMPELDGFGVLSALSAFDEKPKTIMEWYRGLQPTALLRNRCASEQVTLWQSP